MTATGNVAGPVLALDVGTRTIGVAVTDASRRHTFPERTIARRSVVKDTAVIAAICAERRVVQVVVGLPLTPDGDEARSARLARQIGVALATTTALPVAYMDERFSTVEAEWRLRAAEAPAASRRASIDQYAAIVILEDWLAARARPQE